MLGCVFHSCNKTELNYSFDSYNKKRDIDKDTDAPLKSRIVAMGKSAEPEDLVRKCLIEVLNFEKIVKPGDRVVIKPNICVSYRSYEYAATTNPWVVGALVKLCKDAGAKTVTVMDYPFGGRAAEAYRNSGIEEQVVKNGGKMEIMSEFKFVEVKIPDGVDLKKCRVYKDVLEADVFINVPIAKHHGLARLTLGMKNLMGVVRDRPSFHFNLGQRVADLASLIRPTLTVVDAIRTLVDNGPTGGRLEDVRKMDTVIASTDFVAADAVATTLFGLKPEDISYIQKAAEMGLGEARLEKIEIVRV